MLTDTGWQELARRGIAMPPATGPVAEAQALMSEAWADPGTERVRLARQVTEVSADCADAYVLLTEEAASTSEQALDLYLATARRAAGAAWARGTTTVRGGRMPASQRVTG